jgi:hypothetical protein
MMSNKAVVGICLMNHLRYKRTTMAFASNHNRSNCHCQEDLDSVSAVLSALIFCRAIKRGEVLIGCESAASSNCGITPPGAKGDKRYQRWNMEAALLGAFEREAGLSPGAKEWDR